MDVWTLNEDVGLEWLIPYRQEHNLHLKIMQNADDAFVRYKLGRAHRQLPPLYIIIDKQGIIRHRSWSQGSISLESVRGLVEQLINE